MQFVGARQAGDVGRTEVAFAVQADAVAQVVSADRRQTRFVAYVRLGAGVEAAVAIVGAVQRVGQEPVLMAAICTARTSFTTGAEFPAVVATRVARIAAFFEIVARLARDDVGRAAYRVLAVRRSLRATQYFDPHEVVPWVIQV